MNARRIRWPMLTILALATLAATSYGEEPLPEFGLVRMGNTHPWQGRIESVMFSPDGTMFASAGEEMILWDTETGDFRLTLRGHGSTRATWAWSPDGTWLVSGSADKTVRIWDLPSGEDRVIAQLDAYIRSVAISPDGRLIAAGTDSIYLMDRAGTVRILDRHAEKKHPHSPPVSDRVNSVQFSPDGQRLAAGTNRGDLLIFDTSSGELTAAIEGKMWGVSSIAFSPDSMTIATTSFDNRMRTWCVETGEQRLSFSAENRGLDDVAYSPDGKLLATAGVDGMVRLWDANSGEQLSVIDLHIYTAYSVAFSPDGRTLAIGSKFVRLWDLVTQQPIQYPRRRHYAVQSITFSDDGEILKSLNSDDVQRTWDVSTGQLLSQKPIPWKRGGFIAKSSDHKVVAERRDNDEVIIRAVDSPKPIATLGTYASLKESLYGIRGVGISPDGKTIAVGGTSSRTVWLWDVDAAKHVSTLDIHPWPKGRVRCGSCNPGVHTVVFSADGKLLASSCNDTVVTDLTTGREIARVSKSGRNTAISPDSRYIALSHTYSETLIFDIVSGKQLLTLNGHRGKISSIAFSRDGKLLATGSADTTIVVWDFAAAIASVENGRTPIDANEEP